jgi:hypothetical protein
MRLTASGTTGDVASGQDAAGNVDGDEGIETFGVAGFASRPNGDPEAIVIRVGGSGHRVIVATRDVAMQAAGVGDLAAGEVAIFTDRAFLKITADGEILLSKPGGIAPERICTESHIHTSAAPGSPTSSALPNPLTVPPGLGISSVAKAEGI